MLSRSISAMPPGLNHSLTAPDETKAGQPENALTSAARPRTTPPGRALPTRPHDQKEGSFFYGYWCSDLLLIDRAS